MNNFDNHRSVALALFAAVVLAYVGEWFGFSAMVGIAILQTYREHRFRKLYFKQWEIEQQQKEGDK